MLKKSKKWVGYDFNYGHYDNPPREGSDENDEMKQFFKDFRSDLKKALKEINCKVYHMKKNYYDVTAVISNESEDKFVYLSLGDMRGNPYWNERILIRTMAHSKDWVGGSNHWTTSSELMSSINWLMRR